MTYLELVNSVLDRLREDRVNSVAQTDYSRLVGAFVNDAKRTVEDSWPWSSLLRTVTLTVPADTNTFYDLEDLTTNEDSAQFNERARLFIHPRTSCPLIKVVTSGKERELYLVDQAHRFVDRSVQANTGESGQVDSIFLSTNPSAVAGKSRIRIYTYPSKSDDDLSISIWFINPQNDLSLDADVLQVPSEPVKQLAYLYCLYERGEELGEFLTLTSSKVDIALSDAISHDVYATSEPVIQVN